MDDITKQKILDIKQKYSSDFLKKEGILEEIEEVVAKKIFVFQMEKEMKKQGSVPVAHRCNELYQPVYLYRGQGI